MCYSAKCCWELSSGDCGFPTNKEIRDKEFNNTIITLRIKGTLHSGKPTDINFKDMFKNMPGFKGKKKRRKVKA